MRFGKWTAQIFWSVNLSEFLFSEMKNINMYNINLLS